MGRCSPHRRWMCNVYIPCTDMLCREKRHGKHRHVQLPQSFCLFPNLISVQPIRGFSHPSFPRNKQGVRITVTSTLDLSNRAPLLPSSPSPGPGPHAVDRLRSAISDFGPTPIIHVPPSVSRFLAFRPSRSSQISTRLLAPSLTASC